MTTNKLSHDPLDPGTISTAIAVDGLGRPLYTAKTGETRNALGERTIGWNVSGAVKYDAFGRQVESGVPVFQALALPVPAPMRRATKTSYDALDRPVRVELPDGNASATKYAVTAEASITTSTDPLGNKGQQLLDARGNIVAVRRYNISSVLLSETTYKYDGLGQMLTALDFKKNGVSVVYDLLGRRTSLSSADSGTQEFYYDESGNLSRRTDSNLRKKGESISYRYDSQNRLIKIDYPRSHDVEYVYGGPEAASAYGAGRLLSRSDESGSTSYQYGMLGEAVRMERTIERLTPTGQSSEQTESAAFEYVSDYLGRLERITYPDGELLRYGYDAGGLIESATSVHNGLTTEYVSEIGYDEYYPNLVNRRSVAKSG